MVDFVVASQLYLKYTMVDVVSQVLDKNKIIIYIVVSEYNINGYLVYYLSKYESERRR